MKRNYDECVTKYSDSFVRVVLDPGYVSQAEFMDTRKMRLCRSQQQLSRNLSEKTTSMCI